MTKPTGKPIGRPKGSKTLKPTATNAQILRNYKDRLLNSRNSKKVIKSIFDAALNDEHKHQAVAWKIITDRILPVGSFDKDAGASTRSSIQVNISGVPGVSIEPPLSPLEAPQDEA